MIIKTPVSPSNKPDNFDQWIAMLIVTVVIVLAIVWVVIPLILK